MVKTKIIATLGPASSSATVLRKMFIKGLDIVRLNSRLKEALARDIPIVILFEYPTIHKFTRHLARTEFLTAAPKQEETPDFTGKLKKGRDKMKGRRQKVMKN